jgi:hypothetical protein
VLVDADQHVLDHRDDAAQAGVLTQIGHQRRALDDPVEARLELILRHKQQPVAREKIAGAGIGDGLEMRFVRLERGGERVGGVGGEFGRRGVQHHVDDLEAAEGVLERKAALAPGQILRQQCVNVRGQGEMGGGIGAAENGQQKAGDHDATRETQTDVNDPADEFRQHERGETP